jgi:hydroxyethylthiazole kinase-like uncharacterized protein yjeF
VAAVRAAEAVLAAGLPDGTLMQRAATGLACGCAGLLGRVYGSRVVLLVGSGDNGGDALFAGALLARRGALVEALLLDPERAHAAGLTALRGAGGRVVTDADVIGRADLVLDGIVGIGGSGGLRLAAVDLAQRAAVGPGLTVAVDLPSGVEADTGQVPGAAVRADATVTFGTWKPALLVDPAARLAGATTCVDIGLGPYLDRPALRSLQDRDVALLLPRPHREDDKYRRGVLGVVAGSERYPGAATMSVEAAARSGAGMVRFVGSGALAAEVRHRRPEVVATDGRPSVAGQVQAWVVGPGLGTDGMAQALLEDVLAGEVPVLIDADALTLLARIGPVRRAAPVLLTPHAGELARLIDTDRATVEGARLEHARAAAARYGAWVLLKGSTTVVVGPDSEPGYVNGTGTPALATAGSGDVLAGLVGSLLAAGLHPAQAGAVGAHLHGVAGRLAAAGADGRHGAGLHGVAGRSAAAGADGVLGSGLPRFEARVASAAAAPVAACAIAEHIPAAWRQVSAARCGEFQ